MTAADNDKILFATAGAAITLPLATSVASGFRVAVKRVGNVTSQVSATAPDLIDSAFSGVSLVAPAALVEVASTGSSWVILHAHRATNISDGASDYFDAQDNLSGYASATGWSLYDDAGTAVITESIGGNYAPDTDVSAITNSLTVGSTYAKVELRLKYSTEDNYDFFYLYISTNNGASWDQLYRVSGSSSGYVTKAVDIQPYLSAAMTDTFKLKLRFKSDGASEDDGVYIDSIRVRPY